MVVLNDPQHRGFSLRIIHLIRARVRASSARARQCCASLMLVIPLPPTVLL